MRTLYRMSAIGHVYTMTCPRMWPLLLLAGAAHAAEQLMMTAPQQAAGHREEAQAPVADPQQQQWAAAEYYYTPEGYLHQRSDRDPYLGTPVQAGPWVTGQNYIFIVNFLAKF